eukprot:GHVS01076518.1.p1 GENE.GHVS01076518.1~~GHVS01076518.1.p1  ORF type:complete len:124 (-),score=24.50 GHVS01076518.1:126-497(-)
MADQIPSSSSGSSSSRRRRPSLNTVGGPCGWTALSIGDCLLRVLGEMAQEGVLGLEELEQIQQMFLRVCTNYLPRLIPRGVRYKMKGRSCSTSIRHKPAPHGHSLTHSTWHICSPRGTTAMIL